MTTVLRLCVLAATGLLGWTPDLAIAPSPPSRERNVFDCSRDFIAELLRAFRSPTASVSHSRSNIFAIGQCLAAAQSPQLVDHFIGIGGVPVEVKPPDNYGPNGQRSYAPLALDAHPAIAD